MLNNYYVTRDEQARELLITHNLRLVASVVMGFAGNGDLDDLMQVGSIELMRCLDHYDISLGYEFSTYAYKCIWRVLNNTIHAGQKSSDAMFRVVDPTIENEEGENLKLLDFLPSKDNFTEEIAEKDKFERALAQLNEQERYYIVHDLGLFGYEKLSHSQMAKLRGVSDTTVSYNLKNAMKKLRQYYLEDSGIVVEESEEIKAVRQVLAEITNPEHIFILEHYYGINGKEKLTGVEISKILGKNYWYVIRTINRFFKDRKTDRGDDISKEEVIEYIKCSSNSKEIAVLEYRYGLNGKPKLSNREIAIILKEKTNTINAIILRFKRKIARNRQIKLYNPQSVDLQVDQIASYVATMTNQKQKLIMEYFYGLNGMPKLPASEIASIVNMTESGMYNVVYRIKWKIRKSLEQQVNACDGLEQGTDVQQSEEVME